MARRAETTKDHLERLNRVLVHIQAHRDSPLSLEELASIACFSPFHFHRLFRALVGETLNSYVRRTRLEGAATRLVYTSEDITDIALSAGYETPAAFTRAFRECLGKTPSEVRKAGRARFRPTSEEIVSRTKEGEVRDMKPDIRVLPEQKVLFVRKTGQYEKAAAEAWAVLMKFAYSRGLMKHASAGIGICHDDPKLTPEERIRYDACIAVKKDVTPEGEVGLQTIPGGRYAVFLHKGVYSGLGETYDAIFSLWFPASGEQLRDAPCFESYLNRDPRRTKPENLKTEIYVPIE